MDWPALALLSNFLYALGGVNDKGFVSDYIKDPKTYLILTSIISAILAFLFFPFSKIFLPASLIFLLFINGALNASGIGLWFFGLSREDISRSAVLINTIPVFTIFLSFAFLGEQFPLQKSLGISLLILAGVLATISPRRMKISPALPFILLSAFLFASSNVLTKFILASLDPVSLTFWTKLWTGILVFPGIFLVKKAGISRKVYGLVLFNEFLFLLAVLLFIWAIQLGTPSLVSSLGSVYPIFVLGLELIYSKVFPGFVPAELDRRSLLLKVLAIFFLVPGIWLVS